MFFSFKTRVPRPYRISFVNLFYLFPPIRESVTLGKLEKKVDEFPPAISVLKHEHIYVVVGHQLLTGGVREPQSVRIPFPVDVVVGVHYPRIVLERYGEHEQQIEQVGHGQGGQVRAGGTLHRFPGEHDHGQHVAHHAHGHDGRQQRLLCPKMHRFPEQTVLPVLDDELRAVLHGGTVRIFDDVTL